MTDTTAALDGLTYRLSPVICSQGGVPYNGDHIDYWRKRAETAEQTLRSQADEIERLKAERDEARDMLKVEASAFRALYTEACSEKAAAESRCSALTEALVKVADDLEAELRARYAGTLDYPAMKARFNRDMEVVVEARALATEVKP